LSVIDPCSDSPAFIPNFYYFALIGNLVQRLCPLAVTEYLWLFTEDQFGGYDQRRFLGELREQMKLDHLLVGSSCHDGISVI
jgi:hypothetical protein